MTLFAAVACQLCWNLFSACSVFILSPCSPPRCCTWKGATQHLLSWKFQQGPGAAASGAISLLEMFSFPQGGAASTGVSLFDDLWNQTFCLLWKVEGRTMLYYGGTGKNADSHSVSLQLFLVCKWQMAVRHIHCYFQFTLVLPAHSSLGGRGLGNSQLCD